jgi:hypothetical protein
MASLRVSADIGSSSSFRLSVEFIDGSKPAAEPLSSPSLDPGRAMANYTHTSGPEGEGIKTSFGELVVGTDGRFILKDATGKVIAHATEPPVLAKEATGHESITMPVSGSKTGPGANGRRPCLTNGGWGPPFTWDPVDKFFAFAVSPWSYDPDYIHCYPVSFDGLAPLKPAPQDSCTTITHVVPYGNDTYAQELPDSPTTDGNCCAACNDHPSGNCTAWMTDKKKRKDGKHCHLFSCVNQWVPPDVIGGDDNRFLSGGLESQCSAKPPPPPSSQSIGAYIHQEGWFGLGQRMDWYLAPTPEGGFDYTKALFDLTGAPAVPPLFGMGFMATYWGYKNMSQVEQYMHEFRNRSLPIDSFIMDYDWFGPDPCGPKDDVSAPDSALAVVQSEAQGETCTMMPLVDLNGGDIGHIDTAKDAQACCSACWAHPKCMYFTFEEDVHPPHCWMKDRIANKMTGQTNHTSGMCKDKPTPAPGTVHHTPYTLYSLYSLYKHMPDHTTNRLYCTHCTLCLLYSTALYSLYTSPNACTETAFAGGLQLRRLWLSQRLVEQRDLQAARRHSGAL